MTILITACIDVKPELCADLLRSAEPFIAAALAEPGSREYAWSIDPRKPGRIRVLEEWDDEASLQAHFDNAAYTNMRDHITTAIVGAQSMKYLIAKSESVYDSQGKPRAKFLNT